MEHRLSPYHSQFPASTIDQVLLREVNPFDPHSFKPGNFWHETQDIALHVASIHQEVLDEISDTLGQIEDDRVTRTLIVTGESGSGKSHLLGRLKNLLNDRAFFVYIGPWPDSGFIWRHLLRNTVDSLLEKPQGCQDCQLILWLQALIQRQGEDFSRRVFGKRRSFVRNLASQYPTGIYNGSEFFGVLYDLTDPEMHGLAASWLRGDSIDEESCVELRVKQPLDSEDAAQKILANFGKIAMDTQPIVLCFDNLDNLPHLPSGQPDFQSLFNVNSSIHNEKLQNFLVLISIVTDTWKQNRPLVQPADLARVDQELTLRSITLIQAEALWAARLRPYHYQCDRRPADLLAPLHEAWLRLEFPGGKTLPRRVLILGQKLIDRFKREGHLPPPMLPAALETESPKNQGHRSSVTDHPLTQLWDVLGGDSLLQEEQHRAMVADLHLIWQQELQQVQTHLQRINQLSSPELMWRLREVLTLLDVPHLQAPLLQGTKFAAYSLGYGHPKSDDGSDRIGIIWLEDSHHNSFYHGMKACERLLNNSQCQGLYLLRAESLGKRTSKAYQIYRSIFSYANYLHLQPDLLSVQQLETYHRLLNAASGRELVVGQQTPTVPQFQQLVKRSGLLEDTPLLQALGVVSPGSHGVVLVPEVVDETADLEDDYTPLAHSVAVVAGDDRTRERAKSYLANLVTTQQIMGVQVLLAYCQSKFPELPTLALAQLLEELYREQRLTILNPGDRKGEQLVTCVAQGH